jgi:hypothetical protein
MAKTTGVMSVAELEQILEDRKVKAVDLGKRREELQKQLDEIDRQILEVMGDNRVVRRRRRRLKNEMSLRSHVLELLGKSKKGFSMADLTTRIMEAGYKSSSRNFRNVLYQCLYNTEGVTFDQASGCYKLKPAQ